MKKLALVAAKKPPRVFEIFEIRTKTDVLGIKVLVNVPPYLVTRVFEIRARKRMSLGYTDLLSMLPMVVTSSV